MMCCGVYPVQATTELYPGWNTFEFEWGYANKINQSLTVLILLSEKVMQQHALFYLVDNKQYSLWIWAFETCRAITTSQFPSLPKCCGSKWTANSSLFSGWTHVSNRTLSAVSNTSQRESACWTGAGRGTRSGTAFSCRTVFARWGTLW